MSHHDLIKIDVILFQLLSAVPGPNGLHDYAVYLGVSLVPGGMVAQFQALSIHLYHARRKVLGIPGMALDLLDRKPFLGVANENL